MHLLQRDSIAALAWAEGDWWKTTSMEDFCMHNIGSEASFPATPSLSWPYTVGTAFGAKRIISASPQAPLPTKGLQ